MSEASITKPKSAWSLLAGMVDRPSVALTEIVAHPRWRWVLPVTLAILATVASAVVSAPFLAVEAKLQMAAVLNRMPADQLAQMPAQMTTFQTPLFVGATAALTGILALLIGYLLQAAALYFGSLIAGGDIEFGRIFAAVPWLGLPFVLETIVQTVYVALNGKLIANQGLSYLVSTGNRATDAGSLAYAALGMVTLFWLWHLLLVFKFLRVGPRLSQGAAFAVTLLYAALNVGVRAGFAALSRLVKPADVGCKAEVKTLLGSRRVPKRLDKDYSMNSTSNGKVHDFPGTPKCAIIIFVVARRTSGSNGDFALNSA